MKLLALLSLSLALNAAEVTVGAPWSRATAATAKAAAVYAELANSGTTEAALVAATCARAGRVELHQIVTVDGVATMRAVERIAIPAKGSVTLKPGGYHLMLLELTSGLKDGEKLAVTLRFADGTELPVTVPVAAVDAMGACCLP